MPPCNRLWTPSGTGRGTITVADGRHTDCAVQEGGRILYRGQTGGRAIFDGGACEGKGTLVLRGRAAVVEDLVFQNIAVDDGNGAGIRLESGSLEVARAWFRDSQQGILSGSEAGAVTLDRSTFTRLGDNDGGPSHSVYFNRIPSLTVTNCRFEEGRGGHYVKSWAARVRIVDNSFDDAGGRSSNYMIDLPGGASGRIAGNVFVQGGRQGEPLRLHRRERGGGRREPHRSSGRRQRGVARPRRGVEHGVRGRLGRHRRTAGGERAGEGDYGV